MLILIMLVATCVVKVELKDGSKGRAGMSWN